MRDYFFDGIKRLDWGFDNPNITAGLIAILMMNVWIFYRIHRFGFWPSLLLFTGLGVCLIQTVSRGGVVAAVAGGLVLAACAPRPWPRNRWIPVFAAIVLLVGYAFWHGVASRYAQGVVVEDGSVTNRWIIYRMVPAMIVDAPEGWGIKRAHEAFHNFYQPEGRFERYGSLVSSHFTWLAEFGWPGRIAYLFGWSLIFFLCLPSRKRSWYAVALATWTAFAVAAVFTTMANRWVLWTIPVLMLIAVLIERLRIRDWPPRRCWFLPVGTTVVVAIAIAIFGILLRPSKPPVKQRQGWVEIGNPGSGNSVWIVNPDSEVVGKAYGQKIRGIVADPEWDGPSATVQWGDGTAEPEGDDIVFLSGKGMSELHEDVLGNISSARSWLLLNPETPPKFLLDSIASLPPMRILWGEFNPSRGRYVWEALAKQHDHITIEKVVAAGKFLPDWTTLLSNSNDSTTKTNP